jgi:hypothetical protein
MSSMRGMGGLRAVRSPEHSANCNHADHAMVTQEAMLDQCPLAIPAYQARMNLDGLKYFQIAAKLVGQTPEVIGRSSPI